MFSLPYLLVSCVRNNLTLRMMRYGIFSNRPSKYVDNINYRAKRMNRNGAVVRALVFHQCGSGSILNSVSYVS